MALRVSKEIANFESNSSGDINISPYLTIMLDGTPRTLNSGNKNGTLKKIFNKASAPPGSIILNSEIPVEGAATDTITLANNSWVELMYVLDEEVSERYRVIDVSNELNVTLS